MIYVIEKTHERQIELLSALSRSVTADICAWLYPDSNEHTLANLPVVEANGLIPITTYRDGSLPKRTQLVSCTEEVLSNFLSSKNQLRKHCDSIVLYINGASSWMAATVGHEGMSLVQDDSLLPGLVESGFNASLKAPSWW